MCGISGCLDPRGVRRADIERMNEALRHRGPDGAGVLVAGNVGFGHRRLSIIDLAGGGQPMANADGTVWITFNGEIYNYRELRRRLEGKYRFKTHSDTEVILHLYEERGEACLQELRGMFAFAVYDRRRDRLFLARDHLGQKPLYYCDCGGRFAFASEIKALLALMPELRRPDPRALHEYLALRIVTAPRSMFEDVRKLPAGHYLIREGRSVSVHRYWDLEYRNKLEGGLEGVVDELERRIAESVEYHLVSDVPVGAFLSGGMDSSLVVAMMSRFAGEGIKVFAGDLPYGSHSELPYARMAAERCGARLYELRIEPSLMRTLPTVVWHLDEPSDPLSLCMYHISELARREVKVVLGGDGGDELFGGYDRYYGHRYVSYYALLPEAVRRRVFARLLERVSEGAWYRSAGHRVKWIHQMSFYTDGERYARSLGYFYFSDRFRRRLYGPRLTEAAAAFDPEANIRTYFDAANAEELVDRMLYTDSMTRMPDHPVMILDRMTMAHGLEARSPFMDHRLAEFCAAIPPKYKIRGRQRRYIQTVLARRHLPQALIRREKQGFSSPLAYMLADEFRLLYKTLLQRSRLVEDGYFRSDAVKALLEEHLEGRADHGQRLWQLCNAELWYRMLVLGESRVAISESIQRHGHAIGHESTEKAADRAAL